MSPTARTLKLLREEGWQAQVVEVWNPHSKTRRDLFSVIDVLACRPQPSEARPLHCVASACDGCTWCSYGLLGIQACAGASHAARVKKILAEKKAAIWLASGGRLEVWSWSKQGPRGKQKRWIARRQTLTLSDFVAEAA